MVVVAGADVAVPPDPVGLFANDMAVLVWILSPTSP